jgi:NAD(P)-dependent dehydrogenase (short-subunit alcohol dehydrogenase family)
MGPLDGKVVLVTGGTRGIGRVIAEALLARGATVVVAARKAADPPRVGDAVATLVCADVRSDEGRRVIVSAVPRLDAVVHNAGGSPPVDAATASPRLHAALIDLNLTAPLLLSTALYPALSAAPGGGVVVMIGSVSGARPSPGTAAYGAAKAGLHHLARCLAAEWAPSVRVNSVIPGVVATEDAVAHLADRLPRVTASIPTGRLTTPEEVAEAVVFFVSPAGAGCTGAELFVHGGGEVGPFFR